MAAVGGLMDESYAERAKKANVQSSSRNNVKPQTSRTLQDAIEVPSASTSDTLDSSPAHSSINTPATNLMIPPSVPVSSASSENTSPLPSANSLPPRNAWSDRSAWRTPQKTQNTPSSTSLVINGTKGHVISGSPAHDTQHEPRSRFASPAKAPTKSNQNNDPDPFVVNYNLTPSPLTDAQNWPQVGIATVPVSSPHRAKASLSSVPPNTVLSAPQTPVKSGHEGENDATPSKKTKVEKTKWVAIPPKELQAAVDEAKKQSRPGSSHSKSHSPHVNGRGSRSHEESFEGRQGGRLGSREDGSSPITAGNTRHDRNPSLTVPSSASSRRVSPLSLTTSLPSPSTNAIPHPVPVPDLPSIHRDTSPSHPQSHNTLSQRSGQSPAPFTFVEPFVPLHQPNRASNHSRHPSQNPYQPPSPAVYPPNWPMPMYAMPYYPPQNPYHPIPHTATIPVDTPAPSQSEAIASRSLRLKRKRRPQPEEAAALAGYRSNMAETLILQEKDHILVLSSDEEEPQIKETPSANDRPNSAVRTRDPWWSYGIDERTISRWLKRHAALKTPTLTGHQLSEGVHVNFNVHPDSSTGADSPVENAILQGGSINAHQQDPPIAPIYNPSWPTPGAGPSALDIGLAMGIPVPIPQVGLPPPPVLMGMAPPPSYLPSPSSSTSRMDWPPRDDPFATMSAPPPHGFAYQPYGYPPVNLVNGHLAGYAGDGQGRGNPRWREDRFPPRGGRGRGFNNRGRGFRGLTIPRSYNSQASSPGGTNQSPYPNSQPPNSATVYIPEPIMHSPMYPYPNMPTPSPFHEYPPPPEATSGPANDTQVRPPSPKPLTHLHFHLDNTRFKLLGQIEYYFSRDNVAKDIYLRERMDSNGWVPIGILQSFPRIQRLNVSDDLIRETLQWSHYVEVRHNHLRMAHEYWRNFVLPTASESTVPDAPSLAWYPHPPPFHPGYMPPMYPHMPQPYPYYQPVQKASPLLQSGVADHILRRPEEKVFNGHGNGALESGTSAGESFDSTPHTEGEEVETSEDDVVFLIGDPQPMQRSAPVASNP